MKISLLLPPANEVWGKVICLQACVCPQGGAWSWGRGWGCMVPGGCLLRGGGGPGGVYGPRGCLLPGGGVHGPRGVPAPGGCVCMLLGDAWPRGCLLPGGCAWSGSTWRRPPHGYCCGLYASYWNAFLLQIKFNLSIEESDVTSGKIFTDILNL